MEDKSKRVPSESEYSEIVRILLERGADINARGPYGQTALMVASRAGYVDMVKTLLDWEANIHLKDERGYTALMHGAWNGHLEIVKALIDRGADVNGLDNKWGYTALILAAGGPDQHLEEGMLSHSRHGDDEDDDEDED